jgi:hypothetical protein
VAEASHPVVAMKWTMAAGATVVGLLGLSAALYRSSSPGAAIAVLVGGVLAALFWGLLMWITLRKKSAQLLEGLPTVVGSGVGSPGRAVRRGLELTVVVAIAAGLWVAVLALWDSETDPAVIVWGIILGAGLLNALQARDLRRWEERNGLVVCSRQGAQRISWTKAQAREHLVLVRQPRR